MPTTTDVREEALELIAACIKRDPTLLAALTDPIWGVKIYRDDELDPDASYPRCVLSVEPLEGVTRYLGGGHDTIFYVDVLFQLSTETSVRPMGDLRQYDNLARQVIDEQVFSDRISYARRIGAVRAGWTIDDRTQHLSLGSRYKLLSQD